MKNAVFWDLTPCYFCKNDVSEECMPSIIRTERLSEIVFLRSVLQLLVTANVDATR
jgi:hypothetical protein